MSDSRGRFISGDLAVLHTYSCIHAHICDYHCLEPFSAWHISFNPHNFMKLGVSLILNYRQEMEGQRGQLDNMSFLLAFLFPSLFS